MSKVVHLSEESHREAKEYCRKHGLRMSDWVGELIGHAIRNDVHAGSNVASSVNALAGDKSASPLSSEGAFSLSESQHDVQHASSLAGAAVDASTVDATDDIVTPDSDAAAALVGVDEKSRSSAPKKKPLAKMEDKPQQTADGLPPYAAPPFWAKPNANGPNS